MTDKETVSLHDHVHSEIASLYRHADEQNRALRELMEVHFQAHQQALKLATEATEKRLESMNEFREALKDQAATFVTRFEVEATRLALLAENRRLDERQQKVDTKIAYMVGYMVGSGLVGGAVTLIGTKLLGF